MNASAQPDSELIVTEFEMNEQAFVPAGDGEPAQWMRYGDLLADADKRRRRRHARWYGRTTASTRED
jgi:hypothetical protein